MSPTMLRQVWSLVEETQSHILLDLDDSSLVQLLVRQLKHRRSLNPAEATQYSHYIQSHLPLIRDLAQSRSTRYFPAFA
jgi:phosphoenolpyruvate carboxylase